MYQQNVLDYVSYLKNIKLNNAKTINHKLSSLRSYNDFLISSGIQNDVVIIEVANQAGHSNINTTLLYTNPDKAKLKRKMELL
ncbi:hypothetical protein YDYSG_58400 [Paenibacillus tyrfis]|uniref:hypothetical protein n=1 Tax=Paenibacillus tyrfis TaxID=1501230 RepID=UPI002492206E|nr:hypothetical protein [Paenibacillus tyrfis]GLI09807.1 hypothetical protein YDYSG_58400 [Paenibacillus tyrfis]